MSLSEVVRQVKIREKLEKGDDVMEGLKLLDFIEKEKQREQEKEKEKNNDNKW